MPKVFPKAWVVYMQRHIDPYLCLVLSTPHPQKDIHTFNRIQTDDPITPIHIQPQKVIHLERMHACECGR